MSSVPAAIPVPLLAPTIAALGDQPRRVFDQLATAGFRAVQLNTTQPGLRPRELGKSGRRDLLATLRRRELVLAGLDLWIPPEHLLDPSRCDRALGAIGAAIELAAALNRSPLSLTLPPSGDRGSPAHSMIAHIAEEAARHGVPLADHAVPPAPRELIGIGIDPAAWLAQGSDPVTAVATHADRLVSARLVDLLRSGMRGPAGDPHEGRLDVLAYQVALSVASYARPVVVDARQWTDPWNGLEVCRAAWDRQS